MKPRAPVVLSAIVAIALPAVLIGNALWLLMQPWIVDVQYALPGFPVDPEGVQEPERTALAKAGVRAIQPGGDGTGLLLDARLPDGRPAFVAREVAHMADVRSLVEALLVGWAAALAAAVGAIVALCRRGGSVAVRDAVARGGRVTFALIALVGVAMLVAFGPVFEALHALAFDGRSWQFSDGHTLRQLYPDAFWQIAGVGLAALVLAQAGVVLAAIRRAPAGRPLATSGRPG